MRINSPEILRRVNELRKTDNISGWLYLAREYIFLAAVIGGTIAVYHVFETSPYFWFIAVPVTIVAIALVGAGQHRLVTLTHEAAHYLLFRNRLLNEVMSEVACMFPVLGTTHKYRVQHMAHHQFPNDPERDTDFVQLKASGHLYKFPMSPFRFLWHGFLKHVLWPLSPLRYAVVRATFDGTNKEGPYRSLGKTSLLLRRISAAYFATLIAGIVVGVAWQVPLLLVLTTLVLYAGVAVLFAIVPERFFVHYQIKSDLSPRIAGWMRVTYYSILIAGLGWLTYATGRPWWLYYIVLWLVPLGTSFSVYMIVRQLIQHGNADRQRLTNTRIFRGAGPITAAVFPLGNDYHLPHHLFPMVPHYNLRKLHDLLMQSEEYREKAVVADGYVLHRSTDHPTVLELMTNPPIAH